MKQQLFTNAYFAEDKNSFTGFFKEAFKWLTIGALLAFVVWIMICFRPAYANTDWHNNEISQQIQAETRCELKGGVFENGVCLPPNLNPSIEKYVREYAAQKQAEINRTLEQK